MASAVHRWNDLREREHTLKLCSPYTQCIIKQYIEKCYFGGEGDDLIYIYLYLIYIYIHTYIVLVYISEELIPLTSSISSPFPSFMFGYLDEVASLLDSDVTS